MAEVEHSQSAAGAVTKDTLQVMDEKHQPLDTAVYSPLGHVATGNHPAQAAAATKPHADILDTLFNTAMPLFDQQTAEEYMERVLFNVEEGQFDYQSAEDYTRESLYDDQGTATKPPTQLAWGTASPSVWTPAKLKAAAGQVSKEDHAARQKQHQSSRMQQTPSHLRRSRNMLACKRLPILQITHR